VGGSLRNTFHDEVLHERRGVEVPAIEFFGDRGAVQRGARDERRGQLQA